MKRIWLFAIAACLSACGGTISTVANVATSPTPILAATAMDEKAMYAAEAFYNVPAQAYVKANSNGQLSPSLKATLKPLLIKAKELLDGVRAAYRLGDASGFSAKYAALKDVAERAKALIPSK